MTGNDYQRAAMRTDCEHKNDYDMLRNAAYGLCGESGEVIDLLKKHEFQKHPLNEDAIAEELGDVLWYIAQACTSLGLPMDYVMEKNVEKLRKRYPDGFDSERSIHR